MAIPSQAEFIAILTAGNDSNNAAAIRRGNVVGFFDNSEPKIQFAGEDTPREKIFTRLSENVVLGDRVFLLSAFGSWLYWKDYTESYEV